MPQDGYSDLHNLYFEDEVVWEAPEMRPPFKIIQGMKTPGIVLNRFDEKFSLCEKTVGKFRPSLALVVVQRSAKILLHQWVEAE